ncbi:hypothetical protein M405DRAFT_710567, partial [Rhizopogon salebrosus TDB-379]
LLKYQHPQTSESDIPHRTKLREAILVKALAAEARIKEEFKISITFDAWTSGACDPYLAVTA